MPLSLNEIKDRALAFSREWEGARAERAEAQTFYDPIAMPPDLRRAHQKLDHAVDTAYGKKSFTSDAERVAFLFELYHQYTSLLPSPANPTRRRKTV